MALGINRHYGAFCARAFLLCSALPAWTQDFQSYPEFTVNTPLNSIIRTNFEAKEDRDAGAPPQASIGPDLEVYLKPLVKLKEVAAFDLDDAKSRLLVLDAGFRYITAPDAPAEDRMIVSATSHFPMKAGFLIIDRNRADLDWKSGTFTWRYRNRFEVERTLLTHLIPYVAVEPYFENQYHKWSTTALYAGCLVPAGKHIQFESYYKHENNTGKRPNQQENGIGLALHVYFHEQR